jgi:predicted transcriptional regulator
MDNAEAAERKTDDNVYMQMTAEVVSAYVENNPVPVSDLQKLIADVHQALVKLDGKSAEAEAEKPKPAVNPKRSVTDDYIICLEDGQKFKSLKRHLMSHYSMTPEEYREKWSLPADYPMVAPSYAAQRSALARQMGLGRKPGRKAGKKK